MAATMAASKAAGPAAARMAVALGPTPTRRAVSLNIDAASPRTPVPAVATPHLVPNQLAHLRTRGGGGLSGIDIGYRVCGDPDAPHRAVLIMGIFTPADEWAFVVDALLRLRPDVQVRTGGVCVPVLIVCV